MRKATLLVLAVALSGCTALSGGNTSETPQQGLVIEEARITDSDLRPGQSTKMILRVENANIASVEGFSATVSNAGELSVSNLEGGSGAVCEEGSIGGSPLGVPRVKTCVWELEAPENFEFDRATYPVTLTVEYGTELRMRDSSMSILFTEDASYSKSTVSASNGEMSMKAEYPEEVRVGEESIETEIQVTNSGSGRVPKEDRSSSVELSYSGSLIEDAGFQERDNCGSVSFLENRKTTSLQCAFERGSGTSIQADTSYSLRATVIYRYLKTRELPVNVDSR